MYNFSSNTWNVNNDPISSFSHEQYSLNFQKPFLYQQEHNTQNSRQDQIINNPHLHPCTTDDISPAYYNVCFPSPLSEGQNVLPIDLQHYLPSLVREFTDKSSTVVPDIQASDPSIIGGGNEVKPDSSHSRINPNTDYADQRHVMIQQPPPPISRKRGSNHDNNNNSNNNSKNKSKNKKDRHSKILTTTRPRHRRMRLSIEVARAFFDLQDMLGFERASKTVEWLLNKAKSEIKKLELSKNPTINGSCSTGTSPEIFKTSSSNSDSCEGGASGLDEVEMAVDGGDQGAGGSISKPNLEKEKKKYSRSKSKRVVINPLARELREKARERARERTKEKMSKKPKLTAVTNVGRSVQAHQNRLGYEHNNVEETRRNPSSQNGIILQNPNPFESLLQAYCDRRCEYLQEQVWNFQGQNHLSTPGTANNTTTASLADEWISMNQMGKWNAAPALSTNSEFGIPQEFCGFQL